MKTATFEIRVFKKGNYIYVVPTDSVTEIEGFAKDVKIARKTITSSDWAFYGFNSDVEIRDYEFPISLIKKENGDAYTNEEFKDWKDENTGFNGGGTAPNDVWQAQVYENRTAVIYENKLYILSDTTTLPFNSTDFTTELAAGSWVEVGSLTKIYSDTFSSLFKASPLTPFAYVTSSKAVNINKSFVDAFCQIFIAGKKSKIKKCFLRTTPYNNCSFELVLCKTDKSNGSNENTSVNLLTDAIEVGRFSFFDLQDWDFNAQIATTDNNVEINENDKLFFYFEGLNLTSEVTLSNVTIEIFI